jgi:hypothetical protein
MPPHLVTSERWSDQDKDLVLRWLATASRDEESQTVPAPKGESFRRDRTFRIPEGFVIPSEGGEIGTSEHFDSHPEQMKCSGSKLGDFNHQPPEKWKVLVLSTMTGPLLGMAISKSPTLRGTK